MASTDFPPILLVHGAWHGKWCYEKHFVPYLQAQGFDVHAIDLPGHGDQFVSTSHIRWLSSSDYVSAVADYVATLPQPPIIVGHSMGGYVLQKYLDAGHDAAGGVLLASIPVDGIWRMALNLIRHYPAILLKGTVKLSAYPIVETPELAHAHFFSAHMPKSEVAEYHAMLHDESFQILFDTLLFNLPKPEKVNRPLLVLGAENDTIFSVESVQKTAESYGTEAVIIPDMAHDMMLESRWQEAADHIVHWVRENFAA